jgi:hypothetical protein
MHSVRRQSVGWQAPDRTRRRHPRSLSAGASSVVTPSANSLVPGGGPDYVRLTIHSTERMDHRRRAKHVIEQWSRTKLAIIYWCVESLQRLEPRHTHIHTPLDDSPTTSIGRHRRTECLCVGVKQTGCSNSSSSAKIFGQSSLHF